VSQLGKERDPETAEASLRFEVPPETRWIRVARQHVAVFARAHGLPDRDAIDFLTAVAEAVANAVEHGRSERPIEVSCRYTGGRLIATVDDHGVGFSVSAVEPRLPEPLAERGRGLPIMKECTDLFSIRSSPGHGTSVLLGRYVVRGDDEGRKLAS
jgi:anti-sigma regulatory factor (Ser/Thr protein kinase)